MEQRAIPGDKVASATKRQMKDLRRNMQIIYQDPYSSLDSRMTIGSIIGEPLLVHGVSQAGEREAQVRALLNEVGMDPDYMNRYPHEFSGGQRQRIAIARALALRPELVIADEPVSALDVSIKAQILNLLENLQGEFSLTYLFISHDLAVVRQICDRVAVMYLGKIVELASTDGIVWKSEAPLYGGFNVRGSCARPQLQGEAHPAGGGCSQSGQSTPGVQFSPALQVRPGTVQNRGARLSGLGQPSLCYLPPCWHAEPKTGSEELIIFDIVDIVESNESLR